MFIINFNPNIMCMKPYKRAIHIVSCKYKDSFDFSINPWFSRLFLVELHSDS